MVWAHNGGGGECFYNGQVGDPHGRLWIPTIANGIDYGSIMALASKQLDGATDVEAAMAQIDANEIWRALHRPPDEKLR